jgi:hypothetical protein
MATLGTFPRTIVWERARRRRLEWLAFLVLAALLMLLERDIRSLPFLTACGVIVAAIALTLTARSRFSAWLAIALPCLSALASMMKYRHLAVNAHVFDIRFYLAKGETLAYLADDYRWSVFAALGALVGFVEFAARLFRNESPKPGLRARAALVAVAAAMLAAVSLPTETERLTYHISKSHFASSFFASLSDLVRLSGPDPIEQTVARVIDASPFEPAAPCEPGSNPPDIVLVLSESAVIPSTVPGWRTPRALEDKFRSFDGAQHGARVETFGGGTWISHTSVLSGLSMAEFGWMRPYATLLLKGRLRHGLATALAACGYRTAFVSPSDFHFVHEGPMIKSLGVEDYLDLRSTRAPSKHEPDSFYFGKALDYYDAHIARDAHPLFLFVATMAAHPPYDARFLPDRIVAGEPFDADPTTSEYLRREAMAQTDYEAFVASLNERRGERRMLTAQFGDHHPELTKPAFEHNGVSNPLADFGSPIYRTFYAVNTHGFAPHAPLPQVDALDLAYLAPTLLQVAGTPLDPAFRAAAELRDHCRGAFHTCADRAAVELYLARMVRTGFIGVPGRS